MKYLTVCEYFFQVVVQKEAPEFDIDKDFESELLRLDEVVEKELQSQDSCVSKLNGLEAGVKAECGEISQKSSLETEEEVRWLQIPVKIIPKLNTPELHNSYIYSFFF